MKPKSKYQITITTLSPLLINNSIITYVNNTLQPIAHLLLMKLLFY